MFRVIIFLGFARDVDNIASTGIITNKTEFAEIAADNDLREQIGTVLNSWPQSSKCH